MFTFGKAPPPTGDIGYAGFRLHYPLNRTDYFDEVCAFLGASYFRAVAKGQGYGMSARGLAIKTADPAGEEFPLFKAFWLERPAKGADVIVVHALLDSQSAAASFRFTIRPGKDTVFDTEMALFPRIDIAQVGPGADDQHVPVRRQRPPRLRRLPRARCMIRPGWTAADRPRRAASGAR